MDYAEDRYYDLTIRVRGQLTSECWTATVARGYFALRDIEERPKPPKPRKRKASGRPTHGRGKRRRGSRASPVHFPSLSSSRESSGEMESEDESGEERGEEEESEDEKEERRRYHSGIKASSRRLE